MKTRLLLNGIFILGAVALGVGLSMRPWNVYREQRDKADAHIQEAKRAETQRVDLEEQKAKYESPLGKEELARNRGYRKSNERPLDLGD
jgi:hypothetical protein